MYLWAYVSQIHLDTYICTYLWQLDYKLMFVGATPTRQGTVGSV